MDITSVIGGMVTVTPPVAGGGGGGTSKVDLSPITLIKVIDRASPPLFRRAALAQRSATLLIDVCSRPAGTLVCNVKYRLENVALTSVATDVALDGTTEVLSVLYGKITQEFRDGGTVRTFCWDVRTGSGS
jgi:type VI protein secretion system component Hcp